MAKTAPKKVLNREFSAGGVVFRDRDSTWLVIKPAGTPRWQFPKGRIDKGESSELAALREVEEEGGVKARVVSKIGTLTYFYYSEGKRIFKTVSYYLMMYESVKRGGHDDEVDEIIFLSYEDAYRKLTFAKDKSILEKARKILSSPT